MSATAALHQFKPAMGNEFAHAAAQLPLLFSTSRFHGVFNIVRNLVGNSTCSVSCWKIKRIAVGVNGGKSADAAEHPVLHGKYTFRF